MAVGRVQRQREQLRFFQCPGERCGDQGNNTEETWGGR